jgi:hypothetical protein
MVQRMLEQTAHWHRPAGVMGRGVAMQDDGGRQ